MARATASNRAIQWGEQIVKPIFESKDDNEVMYLLAKKLGFADKMFKNIKVENNLPVAEDVLREINRGWLVHGLLRPVAGAVEASHGQSKRLRHAYAEGHERSCAGRLLRTCRGRVGGLPNSSIRETPLLYNTTLLDQGRRWHIPRPAFGIEREEKFAGRHDPQKSACSAMATIPRTSEIKDGYPEFTYRGPQEARLGQQSHRS